MALELSGFPIAFLSLPSAFYGARPEDVDAVYTSAGALLLCQPSPILTGKDSILSYHRT